MKSSDEIEHTTDGGEQDEATVRRHRDGTFIPGQSGNPRGRKKGSVNLMTRVKHLLLKEVSDGTMRADVAARVFVEKMMEGDLGFVKEFLNRDEGMPRQRVDVREVRESITVVDRRGKTPLDTEDN